MEAVDHLEMTTQILLGQMLQHACIDQALHERAAILRKTKTRQPFIADPLMTHLTIRQALDTPDHTHTHRPLLEALSLLEPLTVHMQTQYQV